MLSIHRYERTLIVASVVDGILGAIIGALAAGVPGAKVGLVAGLAIAVLPVVARTVWAWLVRPGGLPRFLGGEIATAVLAAARAIVKVLGSLIEPVLRRTQGLSLAVRFAADILGNELAAILDGLWRTVATPLGVANLVALLVIVVGLSGFDFAGPVAFLAFGMLLLVLLVSVDEAHDEQAARKHGPER